MKLAVLAAITGFAVAGIANAEGYDPIETRQAGQDLVSADFAGIRAVVNVKGDVKSVANPAKAVARWIRQFPTQFPKGSEQGHNTITAALYPRAAAHHAASCAGPRSQPHVVLRVRWGRGCCGLEDCATSA